MRTTGTQVMVYKNGRKLMTHESAEKVAEKFRELGGFSKIEVSEFGWDSGCWAVELWSVNSAAGNRTLHTVDHVPATEKEYKLIRKIAMGKASEKDKEAFARARAEREVDAT